MKDFIRWILDRPLVLAVFLFAIAIGPVFARFVFPEAETWRHIAGGMIAGFYFAMCAIPHELLE